MESKFVKTEKLCDFFIENRLQFQDQLLEEVVNVTGKIDEIDRVGDIDLLSNAQRLVLLVVEDKLNELEEFAKQEGVAWANMI
ncbi:hypothetical protein [Pueribacillus sp. YX66]|uniref:hypothetical protein n=1 Tax=Pueribacillus sp. YX66 TaxID=3229242 RepID=UPI00358CDEF7